MDGEVEEINQRLKAASVPVRIRSKGKSGYLYLRATLPSKDGRGTKQQEIPLSLPPTARGLKIAESKAHELSNQLISGTFSWSLYSKTNAVVAAPSVKTIAQWMEEFKAYYFSTHALTEDTWTRHWWNPVLARLPQNVKPIDSILMALVLKTDPHTRLRKQTCQKLQSFAKFIGLEIDLRPYQGNYGNSKTEIRYIPTDEEIESQYSQIKMDSWRLTYALIAVFGLRPHEAFFCEFVDDRTLRIREGKTGERLASAMPPEWIELWGLPLSPSELLDRLPPINRMQTYQKIGDRVCHAFNRNNIQFAPYALRHAYGIRATVRYGLPVPVSAAMMGHSATVHMNTYMKWMSEKQIREAYDARVIKKIIQPDES